jgi:Gti1/Pac2 family transcription factor
METYHGHVRTPADAIILFEACRLGSLPRVQRRLSEKERQSIKSGSIFVWDEREAGMRRWTDGKSWSASRVSGSFLTYREMEGKRGGNFHSTLARAGRTPESTRGSDSDMEMGGDEGPDGYRYKPDGLMKQSFSITTSAGNHLHLIGYYSRSSAAQGLMQPSQDPALRHIRPQKGMYPESTIHDQQNIPAVTRTPMPTPPIASMQPGSVYPPRPGQPVVYMNGQWPPNTLPQHPYATYPATTLPPPPPPPPSHQGYNAPPPPPPPPPLSYTQTIPPPATTATLAPAFQSGRTSTPPVDGFGRPSSHPTHNRSASSGSRTYLPNPSPQQRPAQLVSSLSQGNSPSSTPFLPMIDPQLVAPSPLSQHQTLPNIHDRPGTTTRTPSPAPKREFSATPTSRDTNISSASTIPSIGALVNGAESRDARSRSASRSPRGSRIEKGPQDIPHSKLGFGEDMRALRVLDRAFKT